LDVLEDIIKNDYYISTTPGVAYNSQIREVVKQTPIESLLIETDSPVIFRNSVTGESFQAEPADVFKTFEAYCELKKVKPEVASEILNENAHKVFRIEPFLKEEES